MKLKKQLQKLKMVKHPGTAPFEIKSEAKKFYLILH